MKLDQQQCYAAIKSRDERFDGRFFSAVLTTGVYCRPICPARLPRFENMRFFATAAAAAEAGFRPCLRCRPESSPGTAAWQGPSSTVSRALRLISEGVLDEFGVDEVARRLNIGTRQLRRLFVKHLGASPIAVAQTRRNHFAKKLIDETNLPMSEIAFSAGFSSIRRFNAALRQTYGKSPTELRQVGNYKDSASNNFPLKLRLAYRPPYDWHSLIQFLQARAIPGVESVDDNGYRRTVQVGDAWGIIEVQPVESKPYLFLSVPSNLSKGLIQIVERVRRLFDLNADPIEITHHLKQDKMLASVIQSYPGLRVPGAWDGFEIAVRAILGQQVSVKAATTFAGRLVKAYGQPLSIPDENKLTFLFPQPKHLAVAELAGLGLTPKRIEAIRELAKAVRDGDLVLGTATGLDKATEPLLALPGVGPWTAHYIAMRALDEPDAFPSSDLILRRAATEAEGKQPLTEAQLRQRAEVWRPWRSYAAMYLWKKYAKE